MKKKKFREEELKRKGQERAKKAEEKAKEKTKKAEEKAKKAEEKPRRDEAKARNAAESRGIARKKVNLQIQIMPTQLVHHVMKGMNVVKGKQ